MTLTTVKGFNMKEITISEKNFKRFAKRYQKLHNIGLMDAQEQLSQVLGCSNYHELNKNFQQLSYSYQQYNNFFIEVKNSIEESYYNEDCLHYFDFRDGDIKYVCHYTKGISHDIESEENPFDNEYYISVIHLVSQQAKSITFQRDHLFSKTKSIFDKYLTGKDVKEWKIGFINFLKSLPHKINIDGVYLLHFDKEYIITQSGRLVIPAETQNYFDDECFYQTYDVDYFSGEKYNRKIHEDLDYLSERKQYHHEYENTTQTQIIDKVYGSRLLESFQDEWTTQSKENTWDEDYWENIDDIFIFSGDDLTIIETYNDEQDHHES